MRGGRSLFVNIALARDLKQDRTHKIGKCIQNLVKDLRWNFI